MIRRRDAMKTIAGASAVVSTSGCVQFATQDTVERSGTPAMVEFERGPTMGDAFLASGLEIAVQRTVEQFTLTREVTAHSWGMVYQKPHPDDFDNFLSAIVATFTTPSIHVLGQELNPIPGLSVGDLGENLTHTVVPLDDFHTEAVGRIGDTTVGAGTAEAVSGAFQDVLETNQNGAGELSVVEPWTAKRTIPHWDGDTYTAGYDTGADDPWAVNLRFERHHGDYVIIFTASPRRYDVEDTDDFIVNVSYSSTADGDETTVFHPPNTDFSRAQLVGHVRRTNVRGIRVLVGQLATIVDETRTLLQQAAENSQDDTTDQAISDTLDIVGRIADLISDIRTDLDRLSLQNTGDATPPEELTRVNDSVTEIQNLAAQARGRMANVRVDVDGDGTYDRTVSGHLDDVTEIGQTVRNGTAWPGHGTE